MSFKIIDKGDQGRKNRKKSMGYVLNTPTGAEKE